MDKTATPIRLDDHLCFALYSASMAVTRLYKPMLDAMGLTYPQYLALKAVDEAGTLTIGGLAQRLALEPSTITPLIKRLEAAGFVNRARGEKDERIVEVALTARGRATLAESTCLAEALLSQSAMSPAELMDLKDRLAGFRDRLAA
jgi:DNA-binding MarR family transcriptional regulator